jgi:hypothetical protein
MSQIAIKTQSIMDKGINVSQKPDTACFKEKIDQNKKAQKQEKTAFGEALNRAITRLRGG